MSMGIVCTVQVDDPLGALIIVLLTYCLVWVAEQSIEYVKKMVLQVTEISFTILFY